MADHFPETAEVLARSPEEGARRLALLYLDQAAAALPRLHGGEDPEALHDLRVALRRLRSCLSSYEAQLGGSVPRKLARRLRRLARATGPGRDAEVQLAWVRESGPHLARHHRPARDWLEKRLGARLDKAYDELRRELLHDFVPAEERLRRRLSIYHAEVRLDGGRPPAFGDTAAGILEDHAGRLERQLRRVTDAGDVERAHRARISAKRLRYLADPLVQLVEGARRTAAAGGGQAHERQRGSPLVHRLKELQDLLGELHDAHVMEETLGAALREVAAERAGRLFELTLEDGGPDPGRLRAERRRAQESGLLALARLNRARRDRLFADFESRWRGERMEQLAETAGALAAALRAAAHPDEEAGEAGGQDGGGSEADAPGGGGASDSKGGDAHGGGDGPGGERAGGGQGAGGGKGAGDGESAGNGGGEGS
jgi:CHAD domain-containing protein